jgi:hypothetical protein
MDEALKSLSELIEHQINDPLENSFKKTIALRKLMQQELTNNDLCDANCGKLVGWIINDWGKIGSGKMDAESDQNGQNDNGAPNAIEKLLDHAKQAEEAHYNRKPYQFKRIASWSKYLAFKYPKEAAIYDARVIYSLNWLLLKCGLRTYFPEPPGRNSLMNGFDYTPLILLAAGQTDAICGTIREDICKRRKDPANSTAMRKLKADLYIKPGKAYSTYCGLLKKCAENLFAHDEHALIKVEMILFAIADCEIALDVGKTYGALISFVPSMNAQSLEFVECSKSEGNLC